MLIYNVTIKIYEQIHQPWLQWVQEVHIPEVIATNYFTNAKILRLLDIDDSEGPTYAIQFFANSRADYNHYLEQFAPAMRTKSFDKWGDQFIAFRSIMEVVS